MYYNLPKLSLYWYQVALHPRSTHNHPILLATCLTYFYLLGKFSTPPLRQTLYKKDIIFPRHLYAVNVLLKIFLSILTIFNRKFKIRKLWISATKYCHFLYRDHFHPKSYERYTFIYIYFFVSLHQFSWCGATVLCPHRESLHCYTIHLLRWPRATHRCAASEGKIPRLAAYKKGPSPFLQTLVLEPTKEKTNTG